MSVGYSQEREPEAENPTREFVGFALLAKVKLILSTSCRRLIMGMHEPITGNRCWRATQTLTCSLNRTWVGVGIVVRALYATQLG